LVLDDFTGGEKKVSSRNYIFRRMLVMIMRDKTLFINEDALTLLELIWGDGFEYHIKGIIGDAVQALCKDSLPIYYLLKDSPPPFLPKLQL